MSILAELLLDVIDGNAKELRIDASPPSPGFCVLFTKVKKDGQYFIRKAHHSRTKRTKCEYWTLDKAKEMAIKSIKQTKEDL